MPRTITTAQAAAVEAATRCSTLKLTLSNDTILQMATKPLTFGGITYDPVLKVKDALNLEATAATEGVGVEFWVTDAFRQTIINTKDIFQGAKAEFGCYLKNGTTEWHDVKFKGRVEVGNIDGGLIPLFVKTLGDKAYYGKMISEIFPPSDIPYNELPPDTGVTPTPYEPPVGVINPGRGRLPFDDGFGGRYPMPIEMGNY